MLILTLVGFLAYEAHAQPANDNFANRETIIGTNILGTLAGSTSEAGEPMLPGISTGQTAWWTWTAPSNGIVTLNVSATNFNPLLTVYAGSNVEHLSLVASNNFLACYSGGCGCNWRMRNSTSFHVARGQAYQIAIDSALFTDSHFVVPSVPYVRSTNFFAPGSVPTLDILEREAAQTTNVFVPDSGQTTNILAGEALNVSFQFTPAPPNDYFAGRIRMRGSRFHFNASNSGAGKESGEPDHFGNRGGSSVWYSWTAPASGRVTLSVNNIPPYLPPSWYGWSGWYGYHEMINLFSFCGYEVDQNPPPQFFPVFAVYTGTSVDSLVSVNALPLALSDYPHAISFDAIKGRAYQIAFDGNQGTTGETPLYLALTTPAINDNFERRIPVRGIYIVATGYNAGATRQTNEPAPQDGSVGKSVWWSWRAPVSGTVSIDASASESQFPISVFTGARLSTLHTVARSTDSALTFEAVAGQTYQISVEDFSGLTGAIKFKLQAPVVEVPLSRRLGSSRIVSLVYPARPGQVILLQRSPDGQNWSDMQKGTAHWNRVEFIVKQDGIANRFFYRAIIVDNFFF